MFRVFISQRLFHLIHWLYAYEKQFLLQISTQRSSKNAFTYASSVCYQVLYVLFSTTAIIINVLVL